MVSVIIPTYNREKVIGRAVESILAQTYKNFELIIVDDGSKDATKEFIEKYRDERIQYVFKENGGQNSALNMGIMIAKGEYVAFCDSDDIWLPEKLAKHIEKYLSDMEIAVVYDLTGVMDGENLVTLRDDVCEGWCYKEVLEQGYLTSPTFLSCKKECFEKVGKLPETLINCQDDDLCFKLCKHYKVGLVHEVLGVMYNDANNRITSQKKKCAEDYYHLWLEYREEILKECGRESLVNKYLLASYKFYFLQEYGMAEEAYVQALKLADSDVKNQIREKIKFLIENQNTIILYGAGIVANKICQIFNYYDLKVNYMIAVTDKQKNCQSFGGQEVCEINNPVLEKYLDKPLIIASNKYRNEMQNKARKLGFTKIILANDILKIKYRMGR